MIQTLRERFFSKVAKTDTCWLWVGSLDGHGYGLLHLDKPNGRSRNIGAHRASWLIHNGEFDSGMSVLHRCDNPKCVNPAHLFLGTRKDNSDDMIAKGRARHQAGEENGRAKLTRTDVATMRHLYSAERRSQKEISDFFKIHQTVVSDIVNRKLWR